MFAALASIDAPYYFEVASRGLLSAPTHPFPVTTVAPEAHYGQKASLAAVSGRTGGGYTVVTCWIPAEGREPLAVGLNIGRQARTLGAGGAQGQKQAAGAP